MIVFPMAGMSSRFAKAGYDRPKFMLPMGEHTVFDYAVGGLLPAHQDDTVVFVHRGGAETEAFIEARARALNITKFSSVALDAPTEGQAETVELGLKKADAQPEQEFAIFNIDTFYVHHKRMSDPGDGYLDVFVGEGDNWSFVRPGPDQSVLETAEKQAISNLCCTGYYQFGRFDVFLSALAAERLIDRPAKELYVAPLYNHLIRQGLRVRYNIVPLADIVFSGVPSEYEDARANLASFAPLTNLLAQRLG